MNRQRKPIERFSYVQAMLIEHQRRVYGACAVLGALSAKLHNGSTRIDEDERVKTAYAIDAALLLLTPVACIDSFADLAQQDEDRRAADDINVRW